MNSGGWRSRAAAAVLVALASLFLLNSVKPGEIYFRVDDFGHLAFCRHVEETASEVSGGGYIGRFISTAVSPGEHFPHVHTGRPVTNLFRATLYHYLGESPAAYQTVLLLLLALLAAQLAELAGYLSGRPAGGALCALLFVSCPPVAGLLAWSSHLNLALGLVLSAAGLRLTLGFVIDGKRPGLYLGFPLLLAALLTRETELFVVPVVLAAAAAVAGPRRDWKRFQPALFYLVLAVLLWAIPSFRARSGGGIPFADIPLTLELARITFLAQAGTVLKCLAWFLLLPLALVHPGLGGEGLSVAGGRTGAAVLAISAAVLLLLPGGILHAVLLTALLAAALLRGGRTVTPGLAWAAAAGLPILVYGAYAGRYAVEPLFGLCLALSPLLGGAWSGLVRRRDVGPAARRGPARAVGLLFVGLTLLQLTFNFWPDTLLRVVRKPGLLRRSAHWGEGLVRSAESRACALATFAGRVPEGWRQVEGWSHPEDVQDHPPQETLLLWHDPQGRYLRLGTYYSPMEPALPIWALDAEGGRSWEWNRWFWRSARIKGPSRMLPRLGGLNSLADPGPGGTVLPLAGELWSGDVWDHARLVSSVPQLSDAVAGLELFNHYRHVAEDLGADERQAMVLFETARLFCHEDGRCDAYEKHLLDRIAMGWGTER